MIVECLESDKTLKRDKRAILGFFSVKIGYKNPPHKEIQSLNKITRTDIKVVD